jgi:hypothetical protein
MELSLNIFARAVRVEGSDVTLIYSTSRHAKTVPCMQVSIGPVFRLLVSGHPVFRLLKVCGVNDKEHVPYMENDVVKRRLCAYCTDIKRSVYT